VDVRDFLRLLAKISGGTNDAPTLPQEPRPNLEPVAKGPDDVTERPQDRSPLQQLLADWGKSDSRWDLNGDGTVNIRDFLKMLAKMAQGPHRNDGPREPDAPRVGHVMRRVRAAYGPTPAEDAFPARGLRFSAVG
jgi:hypothetical protein